MSERQIMVPRAMSGLFLAISAERARQDAKWGPQHHDPVYWAGVRACPRCGQQVIGDAGAGE